jgi:hypothetical protein
MLASELAEIYGVQTRALNQAVKRNPARFPSERINLYSSGMSVRLGFAVATAIIPIVLIWMRFSKPPRTFWKKIPSLPRAEKIELDIKMMANTD